MAFIALVAKVSAQTWSSASALPTAVSGCAAATGPDGRVYLLGGIDAAGNVLNTVEAYDRSTGAWSPVAPMQTARVWPAAVTGPDGRIYAIGGRDGTPTHLDSVEAYDPVSNTWTTVAHMNAIRVQPAAALGPDGRIYAIGGFDNLWNAISTAEAYDPVANTWKTVASMGTPRGRAHAVTAWNGLLYVIGGDSTQYFSDGLNTAEAYDTTLDKWTPIAPTSKVHDAGGAVLGPDGRIYAFAGVNIAGDTITTLEAYDPGFGSWTTLSPLPAGTADLGSAITLDGKVLAIGGWAANWNLYGRDPQSSVETIDLNTWAPLPPMSTARYNGPGGAALQDGRILAVGGSDYSGKSVNSAEAYDYRTETWSLVAPMSTPRSFVGVTAGIDGSVYAIGGMDASGNALGSVEVYNSLLDLWSAGVPLLTARYGCAAATGPDGRIYAIGGTDALGNTLTSTEVFDPNSNTWSLAAPLNIARMSEAASAGFDGRIYAVGGWNSLSGPLDSVEVYDPTANTWTAAPSMSTSRWSPVAIAGVAGYPGSVGSDVGIIAVGGSNGSPLDSLEFLDTDRNTWGSLGTMLTARWAAAAAVSNSHGYVFGGRDAGYSVLSSAEAHLLNIIPVSLALANSGGSSLNVTLDAPAPPTGLLVKLTSSNPGSLSIPDSLFIKPNAVSGLVALTVTRASTPAKVKLTSTFQGSVRTLSLFVDPSPTLAGISPTIVNPGGPDVALALGGNLFVPRSYVQFNGRRIATTYIHADQLGAVIPAALLTTPGVYPVTVVTPGPGGGTTVARNLTVRYPVPTLNSLQPAATPVMGGDLVLTITGSGFFLGVQVSWNNGIIPVTFVSSTQLTVAIPAAKLTDARTISISAINPAPTSGRSNVLTLTVNNPTPAINYLLPARITAGSPDFTVTVIGSPFASQAQVLFNGAPLATTYLNASTLSAVIPTASLTATGTFPITVVNPGPGGGASNALTFTVESVPVLTSASPNSATVGNLAVSVTLTGSGFTPNTKSLWNGIAIPSTYVSPTQLTALIPASKMAVAGVFTITAANDGVPGNGLSFTLNNPTPTATGLTPRSVLSGSGDLTLFVSGSGFTQASHVQVNGVGLSTTYVHADYLTAVIPAALLLSPGALAVTVVSPGPGGGTSNALSVTVK